MGLFEKNHFRYQMKVDYIHQTKIDSKLREKIFEYLKKSGKTIVFTDHLYRNEYKEFSVIEV